MTDLSLPFIFLFASRSAFTHKHARTPRHDILYIRPATHQPTHQPTNPRPQVPQLDDDAQRVRGVDVGVEGPALVQATIVCVGARRSLTSLKKTLSRRACVASDLRSLRVGAQMAPATRSDNPIDRSSNDRSNLPPRPAIEGCPKGLCLINYSGAPRLSVGQSGASEQVAIYVGRPSLLLCVGFGRRGGPARQMRIKSRRRTPCPRRRLSRSMDGCCAARRGLIGIDPTSGPSVNPTPSLATDLTSPKKALTLVMHGTRRINGRTPSIPTDRYRSAEP